MQAQRIESLAIGNELLDGRVAALGTKDEVWQSTEPRIRDFIDRRIPDDDQRTIDIARHLTL